MPEFGKRSRRNFAGVHPDIRRVFDIVVVFFDCACTSGVRTTEEQQKLFAQGRTEPGAIVTNCDGVEKLSNHQVPPGEYFGMAVDVDPYPIDYNDRARYFAFAIVVKAVALALDVPLEWGGDWERFPDLPHWQLVRR